MSFVRNFTLGCVVWIASCASGLAAKDKDAPATTSGLPVPRYVSLKSDHVNVRAGPTKDQDVTWITRVRIAGGDHRRVRELAARP
jgi:SH3-like domain-containing protein